MSPDMLAGIEEMTNAILKRFERQEIVNNATVFHSTCNDIEYAIQISLRKPFAVDYFVEEGHCFFRTCLFNDLSLCAGRSY